MLIDAQLDFYAMCLFNSSLCRWLINLNWFLKWIVSMLIDVCVYFFFLIQLGFWLEKWEVGWRRMRGMRELYGIYWNFLRIGGVLTAIVWYCVHLFLPFCRILYSVRSISYLTLILIYLNFSILEVCSFFILVNWLSMPQLDFNFKIWKRLKTYI